MENVYSGTDTIVSGTGMMNAVTPLLSILTAGISGSARLHEKLGTAEALRAVDRCMKRIERAVEAFDGDLIKIGGDEMKAAFHTADAAVHAAIEMQQRIADLPPVSGVKLAIRVGISCGEGDALGSLVDDEATKEAALLAGQAKPAQILISGKIRELMSTSLASQANEVELGASAPGGSVYEVLLPDTPSSLPGSVSESPAYTPTPTGSGCLRLRYRDDTILLNEGKTLIRMGRDAACDLVIHDRRASRHHASIERRGNQVVLIDRSTNGTYVMIDGLPEHFLKQSECILRGKGVILFAASSSNPDGECAEFEVI